MSNILKRRIGDVLWHIFPEYADGLDPILEELAEALGPGRAEGPSGIDDNTRFRLVVEHPEGTSLHSVKTSHPGLPGKLWIKVYRPRSIRDRFNLVRGNSPLEREWKMSQVHKKRNLPVAEYLAMGKRLHNRGIVETYLIQESLDLYQTFDRYYRYAFRPALPEQDVEKKRGIIRELANVARRMHDEGVFRPELKPSQIVVASRERGMAIVLTEPEQAQVRPSGPGGPSLSTRVQALAILDSNFGNLFNLSYRLRFYKEYFRPDNLDSDTFRRIVREIMARSGELNQSRLKTVEDNIVRRREPYYWFETSSQRIFIKGLVYENSMIELARSLPNIIKGRHSEGSAGPAQVKIIGSARPVDVQVIVCPPRLGGPNGLKSGAMHGMTMAAFLHEINLAHFEVLAAVEPRSRFRVNRENGYILLQKPDKGCLNIAESLARKVADEFSGIPWDRTDLIRLAHFLQRMHDMNLVYAPCSGTDIWVGWSETKGREFLFSNPHHLRLHRPLERRDAARHMAEFFSVLPVSEADGAAVLEEYLRFSRRFKDQAQEFRAEFIKLSQNRGSSPGVLP